MEVILNKIEEKLSIIDSQLEGYSMLMNVSKRMNIRISLLVSISILLCSIFFFVVFGPSMLANIIGCAYPIYRTLSVMRSRSHEDYVELLVYWTVFGLLYIVDIAISSISKYLPFFYPFKISLLLLCVSKDVNLSRVIYDNFISDILGLPKLLETQRMKVVDQAREGIKEYCVC